MEPGKDGRRRIAVNLRLAEPDAVGAIVIDHFDGLVSFDDLGRDSRASRICGFRRSRSENRRLAFDAPNEIAAGIVEVGEFRRSHGLGLAFECNALGLSRANSAAMSSV